MTFVTNSGGDTDNLEFGTDEPSVKEALANTLGTPASTDLHKPCDDRSGRSFDSIRYNDITVFFLGGSMSGWEASSPKVTTLDGIGVGSTLADLEQSLGHVTVTDSSLGHEFATASIGGVLDGTTDAAKITNIFNGGVCIIR